MNWDKHDQIRAICGHRDGRRRGGRPAPNENTVIYFATHEAQVLKNGTQKGIPLVSRLTESIECTEDAVDRARIGERKSRDLTTVDIMMANERIQERTFGIELVNFEVGISRVRQDDAYTGEFAYRSICLAVIIWALAEALRD
jgi:hypothetical protein